jgi:hypothetical protein
MFSQLEPSTNAPQDLCTRLVGHLQAAIDRPAQTVTTSGDWQDALVMLRALPLSGDASRLAVQRLNKAQRYFAANEPGAARFELRILRDALKDRG